MRPQHKAAENPDFPDDNVTKLFPASMRPRHKAAENAGDWLGIGAEWVDGLWDGIAAGWHGLTSWLGGAIRGLLALLPDWLVKRLGISVEGDVAGAVEGSAPERAGAPARRPPESLVATAVRVGGEIRVVFDGAPPALRVDRVRTLNPDVPIDVTTGYAMAGT